MIDTEKIRDNVIRFLWDVVKLPQDQVHKKAPEELKPAQKRLVGWIDGKDGAPQAVPIDKIKAADLLLKYLSAEKKLLSPDGERVYICGEEDIDDE